MQFLPVTPSLSMAGTPAPTAQTSAQAQSVAPQDAPDKKLSETWDSELQIVASLTKLQELERRVGARTCC